MNSDELNVIRERTFNENLRNLVNKITDSDTTIIDDDDFSEFIEISEEELLLRFHRLFYKAKYVEELSHVNINYNPFVLKKCNQNNILNSIKYQLKRLGLHSFSLLTYKIEDKSFTPVIPSLEGVENENVVFNIHDEIVKQIEQSSEGYILHSDQIKNDPFLNKKFVSTVDKEPLSYILYHTKWITDVIKGNINALNNKNEKYEGVDSILILPFTRDLKLSTNELCNHLGVPLLLYENFDLWDETGIIDTDNKFIILEYILKKYSEHKNFFGITFQFGNDMNKEIYYMQRYIVSKVQSNLSADSAFITLSQRKYAIFTSLDAQEDIMKILNDYKDTSKSSVTVELFTADDCTHYNRMFRKFFKI